MVCGCIFSDKKSYAKHCNNVLEIVHDVILSDRLFGYRATLSTVHNFWRSNNSGFGSGDRLVVVLAMLRIVVGE